MKIFKKHFLTLIFIFSFEALLPSLGCQTDHITVDTSVQSKANIQRPTLILRPTNPAYPTIERELVALKKYAQSGVAKLESDHAPELFKLISSILERLCKNLNLAVPSVQIYFDDANDSYNAMAAMQTQYFKKVLLIKKGQSSQRIEKRHKIKKNCLQLGDGLIKLLLWNIDGAQELESVMAHEAGHMKQDENMNPVEAEYDADATSVQLIGRTNGTLLIKSINKATLSRHIFNILAGQADVFRLSIDDIHQLNRIITNSIAQNFYALGDLGQCSSHTKFGLTINKVFMDALKYSFDPKKGLTEENVYLIYEKLEKACKNMSEFMGPDQDAQISLKCAYIEEYSNRYFSPQTHPTPEQRFIHINNCIHAI